MFDFFFSRKYTIQLINKMILRENVEFILLIFLWNFNFNTNFNCHWFFQLPTCTINNVWWNVVWNIKKLVQCRFFFCIVKSTIDDYEVLYKQFLFLNNISFSLFEFLSIIYNISSCKNFVVPECSNTIVTDLL